MVRKSGIKFTEAGYIPDDWVIKSFDELFTFNGGLTASRDKLSSTGLCYLHYGDIHKSNKTFVDVFDEFSKLPKLNTEIKKVSNKVLLKDGDTVFVDASEDDEGASKHIVVRNKNEIPFISGLHTIVCKSKDDSLNNLFKEFCFQSEYIKKQFKFYSAGTKVCGVNKNNIKKTLLPIPLKQEQKLIAKSLSEIGKLLLSIEKLIDKKEKIKQGTMQQLLTGKKRLPGFSDEWEVKKLIELGYFVSGNGFPIIYQELNEGEFPFYKVSDFNNIGNEIYMIRANNYIDEQIREKLSAKIIPKNSIIFAKIGAAIFLERKRISSVKCCIDNNMMSYICDVNYLYEKFAYYLYNSIKLSSLVSATALPSLSAKDIGELKINIPINIDEQKAIANILTVMDSEIATLQQKLEKYKRIKQGMMQELLTGRIRLI